MLRRDFIHSINVQWIFLVSQEAVQERLSYFYNGRGLSVHCGGELTYFFKQKLYLKPVRFVLEIYKRKDLYSLYVHTFPNLLLLFFNIRMSKQCPMNRDDSFTRYPAVVLFL